MPSTSTDPVFDAFRAANARKALPTHLDTAGLRQLSAAVRARAVFTARGTSTIYVNELKRVVDLLASGDIGMADARATLIECLRALGYTPEGGFPGEGVGQVPPAIRGSLQDLSSFRRMNLTLTTQVDLMTNAGLQRRGMEPVRLAEFPAFELVRISPRAAPRDWKARFTIVGGVLVDGGRMILFKGDPRWGELGSSENFNDALDVDTPPLAFGSGVGWEERSHAECVRFDIRGPEGETVDEWLASPKRPRVIAGAMPLPAPRLTMQDVSPDLRRKFEVETMSKPVTEKPGRYDYSDLLEESLAESQAAYRKGRNGRDGQ
ncbi:hypothetical protein [Luteolibacter sp. LG18]|uniref:hypothetical protein n=1 Tax=Luteolibacter sp. LG18 TaxID=2819286 RepID=UPI002B296869|nr:hypothetical protein llg_07030 [Luteolibacter sp. LG18]BCU79668.1 hypothetical protein llg_43830 [Luteolibacter sp. LG18]